MKQVPKRPLLNFVLTVQLYLNCDSQLSRFSTRRSLLLSNCHSITVAYTCRWDWVWVWFILRSKWRVSNKWVGTKRARGHLVYYCNTCAAFLDYVDRNPSQFHSKTPTALKKHSYSANRKESHLTHNSMLHKVQTNREKEIFKQRWRDSDLIVRIGKRDDWREEKWC